MSRTRHITPSRTLPSCRYLYKCPLFMKHPMLEWELDSYELASENTILIKNINLQECFALGHFGTLISLDMISFSVRPVRSQNRFLLESGGKKVQNTRHRLLSYTDAILLESCEGIWKYDGILIFKSDGSEKYFGFWKDGCKKRIIKPVKKLTPF